MSALKRGMTALEFSELTHIQMMESAIFLLVIYFKD